MDEAKDLELISIPFALAAAVSQHIVWQSNMPGLILCASAILLTLRIRHRAIPLVILYFSLGLFCGSCAKECGAFWNEICGLRPVCGAAQWLRSSIDNIPYSDERCPALVKALLTGDRGDLDKSTVAAFREAGASHILALSGLHLGMIHLVIRKIAAIFGNSPVARLSRGVLTVTAASFYTVMTGASPSTVRALLFISISEWSRLSSFRECSSRRALLLALTIQIALSPSAVMTLSFQMSYLAMCGIIFVYPALQNWYPQDGIFKRTDPMRRIWEAAALSISCQLFTAPLAWIKFGTFPMYFLLTNVLILPLTGATMIISLLTVTASTLGICPSFLLKVGEVLIHAMTESLDIICRI